MKIILVLVLFVLVVTGCTQHQSSNRGAGLSDQGVSTGEGLSPDGYAVSERRQHERVFQRVLAFTNERGRIRYETNSYTEIETGMHVLRNGAWVDAKPEIKIDRNGAAATNANHQAYFSSDAAAIEAVRLVTPDGKILTSHVVCLSYLDTATGSNALISEVQSSAAQILPPNELIYTNAFSGDCRADIYYVNSKAGLEQNVIIRTAPPPSEAYGLPSASTVLQIWSEFLSPPEPEISTSEIPREVLPAGRTINQISFGAMALI